VPFSIEDFQDLVRLLEQRPEWRPELRRLVLTDELLDLPPAFREMQQAFREMQQELRELQQVVRDLAVAQQRTHDELRELIARIGVWSSNSRTLVDEVGVLIGASGQRKYLKRASSYFAKIARRLRVVDDLDLVRIG
jgi:chromosome segregation ATPase